MGKLIVPPKRKFNCHTEALDRHDRYGANQGTYGYIDKRVGSSVTRGNAKYHDNREDEDGETIEHKAFEPVSVAPVRAELVRLTRLYGIVQNLVYRLNFLVRWGVENND